MKILVIAEAEVIRASLAQALGVFTPEGTEIVRSSHEEALEKFLTEQPSHVVIFDYDEYGDGRASYNRGKRTYQDIKDSAQNEVIVRCGLGTYDYPDYVSFPCLIPELVKKLMG